jgi:hypothetical protein
MLKVPGERDPQKSVFQLDPAGTLLAIHAFVGHWEVKKNDNKRTSLPRWDGNNIRDFGDRFRRRSHSR